MTFHSRSFVGAALVVALLGIAGCSSDSGNTDGGSSGCTFTLSGAQSGSPSCTTLGTFWTSDDNVTSFGLLPDLSGSDGGALVTIGISGQPTTKTYHETDAGMTAAISITNASGQWAMQTASDGTPASGAFTLTITSVNTITSDADTKTYQLHGTLTATLPAIADGGGSGTVTLKATF